MKKVGADFLGMLSQRLAPGQGGVTYVNDERQPAPCHSLPPFGELHPFLHCERQAFARGAARENTAGSTGNQRLGLSLDCIKVEAAADVQSRIGSSDQPCLVSHPSSLALS